MAEQQFIYSLRKPCIAVWPALLEPRAFTEKATGKTGVPKFGAHFSFLEGHADIKAIKELAVDAFRSKYDGIPLTDAKWPWATGVQVADKRLARSKLPNSTTKPAEFFRDYAFVLVARSKYIRLGVWKDGKVTEVQTETQKMAAGEQFYSGVEVVAEFNFKPYFNDAAEKHGVCAYVNMVASFARGKRIGGKDMNETFKNVVGQDTTDDPTDYTDEI